ncbi:MAG: Uma2 family endonuclease [Acidobacteriota bacterium]|nr:Uma2 family endonuclease [Acidobacteriota bacterium]
MIATATDYKALIEMMPPGMVSTLSDVEWEEYEELLEDIGEATHLRLTYDNGRLQIMSLSPEHEGIAGLLPHLILVLAEELGLDFLGLGSTTFKQQLKGKGTEPDDCYYFKNFKKIAGKKRLDLSVDPPPDLAIEIDISNSSRAKFPVYAAMGVPEFWVHDGDEMRFYALDFDRYVEITHSELFPFLTPQTVAFFLRKGEEGAVTMSREFRKWVKAQLGK